MNDAGKGVGVNDDKRVTGLSFNCTLNIVVPVESGA